MKKLSQVEKFLVDNNDNENYQLYRCEDCGIYSIRKDFKNKNCPQCKKECKIYAK